MSLITRSFRDIISEQAEQVQHRQFESPWSQPEPTAGGDQRASSSIEKDIGMPGGYSKQSELDRLQEEVPQPAPQTYRVKNTFIDANPDPDEMDETAVAGRFTYRSEPPSRTSSEGIPTKPSLEGLRLSLRTIVETHTIAEPPEMSQDSPWGDHHGNAQAPKGSRIPADPRSTQAREVPAAAAEEGSGAPPKTDAVAGGDLEADVDVERIESKQQRRGNLPSVHWAERAVDMSTVLKEGDAAKEGRSPQESGLREKELAARLASFPSAHSQAYRPMEDAFPSGYVVKNTFIEPNAGQAEDAPASVSAWMHRSEPVRRSKFTSEEVQGTSSDAQLAELAAAVSAARQSPGGEVNLRSLMRMCLSDDAGIPPMQAKQPKPSEASQLLWRKDEPAYVGLGRQA